MKKPDLESKFVQLSVDTGIQLPRDVRSVPFIIVYDDKGRQLRLTDTQAFYWLRDQMDRLAGDFEAFDSGGMSSSLSDNFAFIGNEAGTGSSLISAGGGLSHNYEFLDGHRADNRGGGMYTPKESEYGGGNDNRMPKNALEKIIEQRNRDVLMPNGPMTRRPTQIDFSKPLPEVAREERRLMQQQQDQSGLYTEAARRRDARINQPRRGIDFEAPDFQAGLTQQIRSARQQFQQQRQTPMERAYQQRFAQQKQMQQFQPGNVSLPQGRAYQRSQQPQEPIRQYQPRLPTNQYYVPGRQPPQRPQQRPQQPQRQTQAPTPGHIRRPPSQRSQQPRPGQVQQHSRLPQQQYAMQRQGQRLQQGQRPQYNPMAGRGRPLSGVRGGGVVAGRRLPAGWRR